MGTVMCVSWPSGSCGGFDPGRGRVEPQPGLGLLLGPVEGRPPRDGNRNLRWKLGFLVTPLVVAWGALTRRNYILNIIHIIIFFYYGSEVCT
jgi:hypothetical protein